MLAQNRQLTAFPATPSLPLPSTIPIRQAPLRAAIGLGAATIGVVFIFNLDIRVDIEAINHMIEKACYVVPGTEEIGSSHGTHKATENPFIQFRRVPNETFGIALFRAAAPAARAAKALTGVTIFGKELFCQMDKRTSQLLEQWKFLRGKEVAAKISSQGYDVPSNMMELVSNEITEQINKAKGLVVEQAAFHELRLTRFQGLSDIQIFEKREEDRIQDVLVQRAEEAGQVDKANAEVRALTAQLRDLNGKLDELESALIEKSRSTGKRRLENRSRNFTSLFELRQLVPSDRDTLFHYPIDWEGLFNSNRGGGKSSSVMKSLIPWLVRKIKDYIGSYDKELVEYVMRRIRLRVDPLDLITDMRQYIDDESDEFVKGIWTILVFETLRKQHVPPKIDVEKYLENLTQGLVPSAYVE
jgi:hypothetical protein